MRNLLLIIHILAAGAWIGGSIYSAFANSRHVADVGVVKVLSEIRYLGSRFFGVAVAVLILSGVGLVLISDVFGWGTTFVLIGIGVVVLDGVFEMTILNPTLEKSADGEQAGARLARTLRAGGAVHFALLLVAVWAMVVKPG